MVSTVKSRPSHYELLGISPAASSEEIAQAFAKELGMLRPRPFGSLAEVTIAYETLRDRSKREAYDASLGLAPEPTIPSPHVPPEWVPFLLRVSAKPVQQMVVEPVPVPSSPPVVAQSLPEPTPRPEAAEKPRLEQLFDRDEFELVQDHRHAAIPWKLPALAAGALFVAVGVGAWTGWAAGNDSGSAQPLKSSATVKVPSAKQLAVTDPVPVVSTPTVAEPERQARTERTLRTLKSVVPKVQRAEVVVSQQTKAEEFATGQDIPDPASAEAPRLPLSEATIARTIGRIGYSCGRVASTAAVEGEPGVFKVICTSGQSYRAAPVHGRYRFRRMGN